MNASDPQLESEDTQTLAPTQCIGDPAPLQEDEADQRRRAKRGVAMIVIVAGLSAVGVALSVEPGPLRIPLLVSLVILALVAAGRWVRLDRGAQHDTAYVALCVIIVAVIAALYVAPFSLVTVPLPLLVQFVAQDKRPSHAWATYLLCCAGVVILAWLVHLGVVDATKTTIPLAHPPGRRLFTLTVFNLLMLTTAFVMARALRRSSEQAMRELSAAHGELGRREALLGEARAEIDRFRAAENGRFSGKNIGGYRIGALLGRGGMGEVYAAQASDGRPVAMKILHEHLRAEPEALQRFFREARVASDLNSPHIVHVLETGTTEWGLPFLAMERMDGGDLGDLLRSDPQLPVPDVVSLVCQVASGLAAAHAAAIVHRDIKPSNLARVLLPEGQVAWKILDFGISKVTDVAATLTRGKLVGTPGYMPPEQAQGRVVDPRADQYSLATVAYRAMTGRPAFPGANRDAKIRSMLHTMPIEPSGLLEVHPDIDRVLAIALAKNPDDRFPSVLEFAAAFERAARGALERTVRARGDARIASHPWGQERAGVAAEVYLSRVLSSDRVSAA